MTTVEADALVAMLGQVHTPDVISLTRGQRAAVYRIHRRLLAHLREDDE
jgi:hypothetical protein